MNVAAPMPIPELGLAYQIQAVVADLDPRQTPDTRFQPNDAIKEIRFVSVGLEGEDIKSKWVELEADQWANIAHNVLQSPSSLKSISFKVKRDGKLIEIEDVSPQVDKSWPSPEQGLVFMQDVRRKRADSVLQAVGFGFQDTWHKMVQVVQNLRGMITGRLSIRNLQGPISIARISYKIAGYDIWEFIFFLGLISINLAVINFLPIPVLDGGHMVFLLYEKLRGKPASEGIRIGATYAGLALILCLMVFVIYLDISRLF